jgi:hypothetical protein
LEPWNLEPWNLEPWNLEPGTSEGVTELWQRRENMSAV